MRFKTIHHSLFLSTVSLFLFFPLPSALSQPSISDTGTTSEATPLSRYLSHAIGHNPQIREAWFQWQAEAKSLNVAYGLPDPQINFGYFVRNIETAVGPQEWKIGFMQMIPWPGKLKVQGDIQSQKAEAAQCRVKEISADVIYQVQSVYWEAWYLEKSIAITRQNVDLIKQWEQIILTKYRTSAAKHSDLIKTQIEAIRLEDNLETLKAGRLPLLQQFRALIHMDSLQEIQFPDSLARAKKILDKEIVRKMIFENNPGLAGQQSMRKAAEKSVTRAKLNWLPDFSVGTDYIATGNRLMNGKPVAESGKDPIVVMGSVSLPLWGYKQAAQVRAAQETELQADMKIESMQTTLESSFEKAWFYYENAQRKWHLYQDRLLPKSVESLKATEKAYIGGETELLSLVDAQRRDLDFRLASERARIDYWKAIAQLEKLAGRSL